MFASLSSVTANWQMPTREVAAVLAAAAAVVTPLSPRDSARLAPTPRAAARST
jgi:hypothetical protein